jgi:hypothetical protein
LKEHTLDQGVIPDKVALVGDTGEQIALGAELHHDVGTVQGIHNAHQGDHIGMLRRPVMKTNLALLIFELSGIQPRLVEGLDGILDMRVDVQGSIYHSVRADTEDAGEFKPVGQDPSYTVLGSIAAGDGDGGVGRSGKVGRIHVIWMYISGEYLQHGMSGREVREEKGK